MKISHYKLFAFVFLFLVVNKLHAQGWKELNPPNNLFNSTIFSTLTDTLSNVYAAGDFKDSNNNYFVAKWNGSNWNKLGTGTASLNANNTILSLARDVSGNIFAAGGFTNSSGNYYIAKWNGSNWSELDTGASRLTVNGLIYSVTTDNLGNVYAGGGFTDSTGKNYVVKWNGSNWSKVGTGAGALNANGIIYAVVCDNTGAIYAAGHFTDSNGKFYVAKWNGSNWSPLGILNANDYINSIKTDGSGNIYAAGNFSNSNKNTYVAKWNGTTWTELGTGSGALNADGPIKTIAVNANGMIYAGGKMTNYGGNYTVSKWNGSSWSEVFNVGNFSNADGSVNSISLDNAGNLYAGGAFINNSGNCYVAKWNGSSLSEPGRTGDNLSVYGGVSLIKTDLSGNVYALGSVNSSGESYVAKWNGAGWSELGGSGSNALHANGSIDALTIDTVGNVYVGGRFINNNGKFYVAKWNGVNWSELTSINAPLNATDHITCLTTDISGNVYVTGLFTDNNGIQYGIAKWNGTGWYRFGSIAQNSITSIIIDSSGNVYVTGSDINSRGKYYVSKVNGNIWSELGTGANALNANMAISTLALDPAGNVYAAGYFNEATPASSYSYVAKWNGTSWSELGTGDKALKASNILSILTDAAGNVYAAGGLFTKSYYYVAKWDGNSWSELGTGTNSLLANSTINTLAMDIHGNIYAAGLFDNTNNKNYVAEYGSAYIALQQPILSGLSNDYCNSKGTQTVRLLNPPATSLMASIFIKLDSTVLTRVADSSFSFNVSSLAPGIHQMEVSYSNNLDKKVLKTDFNVIAAGTPEVNISSNITNVINLTDPVIVTAINISAGGSKPLYTFAKDSRITAILQPESLANMLTISSNSLAVGDNWIYVRMRTSDSCYTSPTSIDSIKIHRSADSSTSNISSPSQIAQIYPNPIHQVIHIKGKGLSNQVVYSFNITNNLGQIVYSGKFTYSTDIGIQLPDLISGLYKMSIYNDKSKIFIVTIAVLKQ